MNYFKKIKKEYITIKIMALAIIVLIWSTVIARHQTITGLEKQIFDYIYNWPDFWKPVFLLITQFGSVWIVLIAVLAIWFYKLDLPKIAGYRRNSGQAKTVLSDKKVAITTSKQEKLYIAGLNKFVNVTVLGKSSKIQLIKQIMLSSVMAYVMASIIKITVNRNRPQNILSYVHPREEFVAGLGFPSGHTTLATVLAITIWPFIDKKYRFLLVAWIVLVGISRIYLGVHAPLDVIGGFGLGLFLASLIHFVMAKSLSKSS